jgi:hypothetical protein
MMMRVDHPRHDDHLAGVNHPIGCDGAIGRQLTCGADEVDYIVADEDRAVGNLLPTGIQRDEFLDVATSRVTWWSFLLD